MSQIPPSNTPRKIPYMLEVIFTWSTIILITIFGLKWSFKDTVFESDLAPYTKHQDNIFRANRLVESGQFDQAIAMLEIILDKEPNYGEANYLIAYVYLQQDKLDLALKHFEVASKYHPDVGQTASGIAIVKAKISNFEK
jgi:tetratricopeptide (TPR) repeat protein